MCPNPDGGVCIGALHAGKRYTTNSFAPALSYAVPDAGWSNDEDLPGNFLLVPPKNTLSGVNAGASDFIGVYTSITPSHFAHLPSCASPPVPGLPHTPAAFAAWLSQLDDVAATPPHPVNVGGLRGLRVDLSLQPDMKVPHCVDPESGKPVRVLPILTGRQPSSLDHGLIPHLTMRLYLLAYHHGVLGIEIDDIANAPGRLASLSTVAEKLRFTL